jgi:hypothetical protein
MQLQEEGEIVEMNRPILPRIKPALPNRCLTTSLLVLGDVRRRACT